MQEILCRIISSTEAVNEIIKELINIIDSALENTQSIRSERFSIPLASESYDPEDLNLVFQRDSDKEKSDMLKTQLFEQSDKYKKTISEITLLLDNSTSHKLYSSNRSVFIIPDPFLAGAEICTNLSEAIQYHINEIVKTVDSLNNADKIKDSTVFSDYCDSSLKLSKLYQEANMQLRFEVNHWLLSCQMCNPLQEDLQNVPPAAQSGVEMGKVDFSAVAPKNFVKGDCAIVNVVMYEKSFRYIVDEIAGIAKGSFQETRSGTHRVKQGSKIKVVLTSHDIVIDDNEEIQEWQGEYLNFIFKVILPKQYPKQQIFFEAIVYVNDIIAAKLKFIAKCSSLQEQKITVAREDVLSAFVSYAGQDRSHVANIIQGMKKARPDMDVFFDVENLRSGEYWEETLFKEIDKRDIFFLCWSNFARQSKWVEAEWKYALAKKGIDFIEPIPIEPPDVCPPPNELKRKHFGDSLIYIINADGRK